VKPKYEEEYFENKSTGIEVELEMDESLGEICDPWDPKKIRVDSKLFSIKQVVDMIENAEIDLAPDFQRLKVWKPQQKSQLIESIFLRIPLPAFYFASDEEGKMQVVDGVQRLSAIYEFYSSESKFRLSGLEYLGELVNKTYADIKDSLWRRRFETTQLQVNVIDPQTPDPVKYDIFRRINTGGTPLVNQEIRHCLSTKRARAFLKDMVSNEYFHKATNNKLKEHVRMADREMALRYCAFKLWSSKRLDESSITLTENILNQVNAQIGNHAVINEAELTELKQSFQVAMMNAYTVFGKDAFRKSSSAPINKALFDCVSVELSYCDPEKIRSNKKAIKQKLYTLIENDYKFFDAISLGTTNRQKVIYRFQCMEQLLEGCRFDKGN